MDDSSVSIEVSFADGTQYTATLVGGEQDNDVAVLKIDATGLQPVTWATATSWWWARRCTPSATPWAS